jgi:hypothetical protein
MSIPYFFDTPIPKYFREKGYFSTKNKLHVKNLLFITWAFSRCQTKNHTVLHDGREINLAPFEFIFGRLACSEESGLTDDEVRYQIREHRSSGLLKETDNSVKCRYSCFRWCVELFPSCLSKVSPAESPAENESTVQLKRINQKKPPAESPANSPAESPQIRVRVKNLDKDQGYRPISEKKSKEHKHLNGEHVDYLKGLGYTAEIATQVIDEFNVTKPRVDKSAKGLIKVWAINTSAAHEAAVRFDGLRTDKYSVASCSRHIEFNGNGACQPIIIKYTEENASEKISDTAKKLGFR